MGVGQPKHEMNFRAMRQAGAGMEWVAEFCAEMARDEEWDGVAT